MWFGDIGLPGFLGGELDIDGVDVGGWGGWIVVRGEEEVGRCGGVREMERVQGMEGGDAGGQYGDEALGPVVVRVRDGWFAKVFVKVAGPVEANDTELFCLSERAELAWIAAAAQADDGQFGDREVARVEVSGLGAKGRGAVFDGKLIERWEAVYEGVK